MRREAHHLSSVFYRGEWAGVLVYAILEDEWCAQSRSGSRK
jgi:RimJ/RimL family protein N-acetyltransferase